MSAQIKFFLKKSACFRYCYNLLRVLRTKDVFNSHAKITNKGYGPYKKYIIGHNNTIVIGSQTEMKNPLFRIVGCNNSITIGAHCYLGPGCSFWMEGNNISIVIGDNTTFTRNVQLNAQEEGTTIHVGQDCMFSNHIIVRSSDSHPIFDMTTGLRINPARPVKIGNHVWIAPDARIMKGADIEDGCIIGSNTMVTKNVPANSLAVGMPARVVKSNVRWSREDVLLNH